MSLADCIGETASLDVEQKQEAVSSEETCERTDDTTSAVQAEVVDAVLPSERLVVSQPESAAESANGLAQNGFAYNDAQEDHPNVEAACVVPAECAGSLPEFGGAGDEAEPRQADADGDTEHAGDYEAEYEEGDAYDEEGDEQTDWSAGGFWPTITKHNNILPMWGNQETMNINSLVLENIRSSPYFKNDLYLKKTFHEVVDEIYYRVEHLEPWERGTRKTTGQTGMCGGVRGVGAGGVVSTPFCILFKLFTLRLTRKQVYQMLNHTDSPYIRGLGFMYIRYCQDPATFWDWFEPYLDDEEEIDPKAGSGDSMTIGQMVRLFLTKIDWYCTLFPRIPVPIQKDLEIKMRERTRLKFEQARAAAKGDDFGEAERHAKLRSFDGTSHADANNRRRSPEKPSSRQHSRDRSRNDSSRRSDRRVRSSRSRSRSAIGDKRRRSRSRSPRGAAIVRPRGRSPPARSRRRSSDGRTSPARKRPRSRSAADRKRRSRSPRKVEKLKSGAAVEGRADDARAASKHRNDPPATSATKEKDKSSKKKPKKEEKSKHKKSKKHKKHKKHKHRSKSKDKSKSTKAPNAKSTEKPSVS